MPKHLVGVTEQAKILWIAGFLEGEGTFDTPHGVPRCRATQVQRQPLTRLQYLAGGTLHRTNRGDWVWCLQGLGARGLMGTLRPFMSPKRRKQIRVARGKGWGA